VNGAIHLARNARVQLSINVLPAQLTITSITTDVLQINVLVLLSYRFLNKDSANLANLVVNIVSQVNSVTSVPLVITSIKDGAT
jgi:hypothetical protein